jgi:hypothetical protein
LASPKRFTEPNTKTRFAVGSGEVAGKSFNDIFAVNDSCLTIMLTPWFSAYTSEFL